MSDQSGLLLSAVTHTVRRWLQRVRVPTGTVVWRFVRVFRLAERLRGDWSSCPACHKPFDLSQMTLVNHNPFA